MKKVMFDNIRNGFVPEVFIHSSVILGLASNGLVPCRFLPLFWGQQWIGFDF